jgi:rod shape determining protein RodA
MVLLQPDLGSAVILVLFWFLFLIFVSGIKWRHLLLFILIFLLVAVIFWSFILADYQKERIKTFLNPSLDPFKSGYNVFQSIIAIGSGKFFGKGLGLGAQSQLRFLPSNHTDFIFAVIAEEFGFIGVLILFSAFGLFFYRGFRILSKVGDSFAEMLVIGILTLIFIETTINLAVTLGLAPVIGITLPFVSYGGSSLVIHLAMAGILESIAIRQIPKI